MKRSQKYEESVQEESEFLEKVKAWKNQINENQSMQQAKKQDFQQELEKMMTKMYNAFSNKQYGEAKTTLKQVKFYEQALQQL